MSERSITEFFDAYGTRCEQHPEQEWPHKLFLSGEECPGPGMPLPNALEDRLNALERRVEELSERLWD